MTCFSHVQFRLAGPADAEAVAALHADSWRRHYRGAYSDAFLDGDVVADRRSVWSARLQQPQPARSTILAEEHNGTLVGFAHVIFEADPRWGALLENLHVTQAAQCRGIGARLLALIAETVCERGQSMGLYLWVLKQNLNAQGFYQACGGKCVETAGVPAPGGVASRLNGTPTRLRYVWPDPSVLTSCRCNQDERR